MMGISYGIQSVGDKRNHNVLAVVPCASGFAFRVREEGVRGRILSLLV
jgi:hypothetical protein